MSISSREPDPRDGAPTGAASPSGVAGAGTAAAEPAASSRPLRSSRDDGAGERLLDRPLRRDPLLWLAAFALLAVVVLGLRGRVDPRAPFAPALAWATLQDLVTGAVAVAVGLLILALFRAAARGSLRRRLVQAPSRRRARRRPRSRRRRTERPGRGGAAVDGHWQPPRWHSLRGSSPRRGWIRRVPRREAAPDPHGRRHPRTAAESGLGPAAPAPSDPATPHDDGSASAPAPPPLLTVEVGVTHTVAGLPVPVAWRTVGADRVVVDGQPQPQPAEGQCTVQLLESRPVTVEATGATGRTVVTTAPVQVLPVALFQPEPPGHPPLRLTADVQLESGGVGTVLAHLDDVYARQGDVEMPPPPGPPRSVPRPRTAPSRTGPRGAADRGAAVAPLSDPPVLALPPVLGLVQPSRPAWRASRTSQPQPAPPAPPRPDRTPRPSPSEPSAARAHGGPTPS